MNKEMGERGPERGAERGEGGAERGLHREKIGERKREGS